MRINFVWLILHRCHICRVFSKLYMNRVGQPKAAYLLSIINQIQQEPDLMRYIPSVKCGTEVAWSNGIYWMLSMRVGVPILRRLFSIQNSKYVFTNDVIVCSHTIVVDNVLLSSTFCDSRHCRRKPSLDSRACSDEDLPHNCMHFP